MESRSRESLNSDKNEYYLIILCNQILIDAKEQEVDQETERGTRLKIIDLEIKGKEAKAKGLHKVQVSIVAIVLKNLHKMPKVIIKPHHRDINQNNQGSWNKDREQFQNQANQRQDFQHGSNDVNQESYDQWKIKEEQFHLEQAILRSKLRISSNREKPIDFLAKVILIVTDKLPVSIDFLSEDYKFSYQMMEILSLKDLLELRDDILVFLNIDKKNQGFQSYWISQLVLCESLLEKKKKIQEQNLDEPILENDDNKLVQNEELEMEAESMIEGKSIDELIELQKEIQQSLTIDKSFAMEMQYWQNLLKRIKVQLAKLRIEKIYSDFVNDNKLKIEDQIRVLEEQKAQENKDQTKQKSYKQPFTSLTIDNITNVASRTQPVSQGQNNLSIDTSTTNNKFSSAYNEGDLSPILISFEEAGFLKSVAINESEDQQDQDIQRKQYIQRKMEKLKLQEEKKDDNGKLPPADKVKKTALNTLVRFDMDAKGYETTSNAMYDEIRRKGLGADEVEFTDIVSQDFDNKVKYDWSDKFKPRKPKFFCSVLTGYEWNKYNQTHYDADNPPPKIVQGYKFNIFYPDLIDKTKTPRFFLESDLSSDTITIRFHAGPPYEDIAFKIINREWEMSERHGFRNVFDRGVLQLYFSFKKHRYRR